MLYRILSSLFIEAFDAIITIYYELKVRVLNHQVIKMLNPNFTYNNTVLFSKIKYWHRSAGVEHLSNLPHLSAG